MTGGVVSVMISFIMIVSVQALHNRLVADLNVVVGLASDTQIAASTALTSAPEFIQMKDNVEYIANQLKAIKASVNPEINSLIERPRLCNDSDEQGSDGN